MQLKKLGKVRILLCYLDYQENSRPLNFHNWMNFDQDMTLYSIPQQNRSCRNFSIFLFPCALMTYI